MRYLRVAVVGIASLMLVGLPVRTALGDVSSAGAPPGNDDYAAAVPVDVLPFSDEQDMSAATSEPLETAPACEQFNAPFPMAVGPAVGLDFRTVWYRIEPTASMTISIDPTASDFTLAVALYEGSDILTQRELACVFTDGGSGILTADLVAGRSYAIQAIRFMPDDGTALSLSIVEGSVPVLPPDPVFRSDDGSGPATGDATVVAVIDSGISPYHWDFAASRMPQALDTDPVNDLPLDQPPDTWLPGFPDPDEAFASFNRLGLTLEEDDPAATYGDLRQVDAAEWDAVQPSTADDIHYHWVPGTKVIGAMTFSPDGRIEPPARIRHGHAVASAAVGNYVGTCPECLLVFLQMTPADTGEQRNRQFVAAVEWALDQPWIDVVSSSTGISLAKLPDREPLPGNKWQADFFEAELDVTQQRSAVERGQALFQASGNGLDTAFVVPNPTLSNSHMGPDWLVTVGGVDGTGEHLTGAGKPVDVAGVAILHPVSHPDAGVGERRHQSGTSFAAPSVAGVYGHALHHARRALPGASRTQAAGVIAVAGHGHAPGAGARGDEAASTDPPPASFACAGARSDCELADGVLTADELRTRLLHGVLPTANSSTRTPFSVPPGSVEDPDVIADEWTLANQGHGAYFGRAQPDADWLAEADRVLGPIQGRAQALDRPEGEREWMVVDSFCRQEIWGSWEGGYYVDGDTALPGTDTDWPIRSTIEATCPHLPLPLPVTASASRSGR